MPLSPGQILNNRYRIVKLLGQGGMGAVYLAWDITLDRPCAVKENLDTDPAAQRQFEREAKLLAKLHHPNLPQVTDHFFIPGQVQYLVMDYIEGEDLGTRLSQAGMGAAGSLSAQEVLPWLGQICDALAYLHTRTPPVIHRDVKPANIKITPEGQAVLVDFGIAKVYDPNLKTLTGARAATPGYAPPEQFGLGITDAQSDVYALGATAYHLLTGKLPPAAMDITAGLALRPPPVRTLNPAISESASRAIEHAMQLNRAARTISAAAFKAELGQAAAALTPRMQAAPLPATLTTPQASGAPYASPPFPSPAAQTMTAPPTPRKFNSIWILVVMALLAITGWAATSLTNRSRQGAANQTATLVAALLGQLTPSPDLVSPTRLASLPFTLTPRPHTRAPLSSTSTPLPLSPTPLLPTSTRTPIAFTSSEPPVDALLGDTWIRPADGTIMVYIPAGEFLMGSADSDPDAQENEKPQHTVYLDAYWIDRTEVTNAQFAKCVATGECRPHWLTSSYTRDSYYGNPEFDNYPVILVSWEEASAYCAWVAGRLPTEAEWEKAARGTDGRIYPWGDQSSDCTLANMYNHATGTCEDDTSQVGSYPAGVSPYGALDMIGNVMEWAQDWYSTTYYAISPASNPTGASSGQFRVLRGGDSEVWREYSVVSRAPNYSDSHGRKTNVGFRCSVPSGK